MTRKSPSDMQADGLSMGDHFRLIGRTTVFRVVRI